MVRSCTLAVSLVSSLSACRRALSTSAGTVVTASLSMPTTASSTTPSRSIGHHILPWI